MAAFSSDGNAAADFIIGIDLGTTYCCVAVWDKEANKPKVLPCSNGALTMPSYVAFTEQARVVGQAAKNQAPSNPKNTLYDMKRIIGRPWHDPVVQAEKARFPFTVVDGGNSRPQVEVDWKGDKKRLAPEMVSAIILTELKKAAEDALGTTVKSAVITVPAHFNDQQRQATKDAGRIAGLDVKRIINEPTAAALAYGLHGKQEEGGAKNVVIFDLGGGTFDVSVLEMQEGVFEVKATGGDTHLGGEDFDNNMVTWAVGKFEDKSGKDAARRLKSNVRAMRRLQTACEKTKRALSTAPSATLEVDSILEDHDLSVEVKREDFEKMNSELFDKCMATVLDVLKDAKVDIAMVTDCVLVGGSTRVPALQDQLKKLFEGRVDLCRSINPDEAVAVGAAVQGQILASGGSGGGRALSVAGQSTDLVLLDVTPLSLGIELEGKEMSVLVKRNTPIPCQRSRSYTTVEDYQTTIDVVIYEGEKRSVDACNKLGEFKISGVERAKKGEAQVEVTFTIDTNGILSVSAQDKVTGAQAGAKIAAKDGRLSEEEIEALISEAEKDRTEDAEYASKLDLQNALEGAVFSQLSIAKKSGDQSAISLLEGLRDWLDYDAPLATLAEMQERAETMKNNFGVEIAVTHLSVG